MGTSPAVAGVQCFLTHRASSGKKLKHIYQTFIHFLRLLFEVKDTDHVLVVNRDANDLKERERERHLLVDLMCKK